MTTSIVDRGGPFARAESPARNWMRAAAPGIASRDPAGESSPIDGARRDAAEAGGEGVGRRRVRLKRVLTLAFGAIALAGALMLGDGLYIHAKAQLAQVLLERAWQRTRETGEPSRPWPWADTHAVARLRAPAQDADVLVLAGASGRTLAFGPGHLDGSARPGDPGNAVITAHRDTHFRFLRAVAKGDELVVERTDGATRRFRIREAYVADRRALQLPRDTDVPTLTLVTCWPFESMVPGGPLRYVVVAEAVEETPSSPWARTDRPT